MEENLKNILVLCTGNSCRSQMAEGFLKRLFVGQSVAVYSAGLESHGLNPRAVKVMAETGIDISDHSSDNIEKYEGKAFDYILTVCDHASENCPVFPGNATRLHQSFPDPAKASGSESEIMEEFRHTRDLIKDYLEGFVATYFEIPG